MFARHLTPYEAEKAERERIRRKAPHLALVDHTPARAKAAEPDHFAWQSLADLMPISGELAADLEGRANTITAIQARTKP